MGKHRKNEKYRHARLVEGVWTEIAHDHDSFLVAYGAKFVILVRRFFFAGSLIAAACSHGLSYQNDSLKGDI